MKMEEIQIVLDEIINQLENQGKTPIYVNEPEKINILQRLGILPRKRKLVTKEDFLYKKAKDEDEEIKYKGGYYDMKTYENREHKLMLGNSDRSMYNQRKVIFQGPVYQHQDVIDTLEKNVFDMIEKIEDKEEAEKESIAIHKKYLEPLDDFLIRNSSNDKGTILEKSLFLLDSSRFIFAMVYQFYITVIGNFLILFVEQQCGNNTCGIFENIFIGKQLYDATFIIGLLSFMTFTVFHIHESSREAFLKKHFEIRERETQHHRDTIFKLYGDFFEFIDLNEKYKPNLVDSHILNFNFSYTVYKFNYRLIKTGYACFGIYFVNVLLNLVTLLINNNNQKTYIGILTNLFIFFPKLYEIYIFINIDESSTVSPYITTYAKYEYYNREFLFELERKILRECQYYLSKDKKERDDYKINNEETV
jgi:hypothetical protein